jgi:hypothetical protein
MKLLITVMITFIVAINGDVIKLLARIGDKLQKTSSDGKNWKIVYIPIHQIEGIQVDEPEEHQSLTVLVGSGSGGQKKKKNNDQNKNNKHVSKNQKGSGNQHSNSHHSN